MTAHGEPLDSAWRLALARVGQVHWELIQPLDDRSTYGEFLAEKGEGVHHIGVAVPSYDDAIAAVAAEGRQIVLGGEYNGVNFAYLPTGADLGVITEIFDSAAGRRPAAGFRLSLISARFYLALTVPSSGLGRAEVNLSVKRRTDDSQDEPDGATRRRGRDGARRRQLLERSEQRSACQHRAAEDHRHHDRGRPDADGQLRDVDERQHDHLQVPVAPVQRAGQRLLEHRRSRLVELPVEVERRRSHRSRSRDGDELGRLGSGRLGPDRGHQDGRRPRRRPPP